MGLGTSKYEAELKEFELALEEWEEVCAAMAAEEAAAAYDASMGGCGLTLYCAQQCAGVALELPCRVLWHSGCAAEDPSGTGPLGKGPNELLRAICIMSCCPTRLIESTGHAAEIYAARRRAYELDLFTGGSAMTAHRAQQILEEHGWEAAPGGEPNPARSYCFLMICKGSQ